mgnify:CR=1 FL=1
MFPRPSIPAYKVGYTEPVRTTMPFAAIVHRLRSISLSIGQLTFGSFLLVLAAITATSREQLDNLYRALSSHPMVKVVL